MADVDLASLRDRYLAAQLAGDRRLALRLITQEGLQRGATVEEIQRGVIQEAQREIGRLWQENAISIAQEHMATAIANMALAHLYDQAPPAVPNGKKVLVACVEGEHHDFPARLVADALDLAGFEVRYLGANVPTDSLLKSVQEERPDLVALSVTMTFNVPAVRDAVARLRAATDRPLALGGGACQWSQKLAEELRPEISARDATELVEAARRLLQVNA